jgi:hypothetical protein
MPLSSSRRRRRSGLLAYTPIYGGYPESESAISKYALAWMIDEAVAQDLKNQHGDEE